MSKIESADTERLLKLLCDELDLHKKIRKLTEEQTELLTKDEMEAFNSSLDKREELIEQIKGLHQESKPLMQSYASSSNSSKKDSKIDDLKKEIREVIEKCAHLNDENINNLKEKTENLTKKIDEKSAQRKGIGGYAQAVPNTPEMFDKKT